MIIIRLSTFLDFGGVERRLANIAHHQDENEWVFACFDRKGIAAKEIEAQGKRVENLNTKASIYSIGTLWKTYRFLKKEKPDVIHTSGAEANFHGILAAKLASVPTIIGEEIGTPNHSKKAQMIFSFVYRFADFVIGNSQAVLDVVHQLDKVPKRKLVQIDNPILFKDLSAYVRNKPSDEFQMLMISRLEPVKNIEGMINVLKQLKNKTDLNLRLIIAGSGQSESILKQQVKDLGLENEVEFLGLINDPYPHLVNADLYILNSHSEGFSNSLIEAMYSKTPSLSTEVGAAPQIIVDGINGFLVPANNEEALFKKLLSILKISENKLLQIGLKGHDKIVNNFALKNHIEKLFEIYIK